MKILEEIVNDTKSVIRARREILPVSEMSKSPMMERETRSFSKAIRNGSGIIAEFKRKSPSAGNLLNHALEDVVKSYDNSAVSAISILTNKSYFGGSFEDLKKTRQLTDKPILRKDFIIDEYQIFEAKANGADAVLLIAAILDEYHIKYLTTIAHSIGLEVLLEIHAQDELSKIIEEVDVVGINNRNLDTLEIDLNNSVKLGRFLPFGPVRISESGIRISKDIQELSESGFEGYLIGESVLKDPEILEDLVAVSLEAKTIRHVS